MAQDSSDQDFKSEQPLDIDVLVDARLLRCPLPLLRAKQALNKMLPGQRLQVLATDAGSERDFHSFAKLSGNPLINFSHVNNEYQYVLVKKSESES